MNIEHERLHANLAITEQLLTPRFDRALTYAAALHRQQRRKLPPVPYISHLLGVAALVIEDGGSEDEAIAALLHDAVEDQGGEVTQVAIERQFGEQVAFIVEGCTVVPMTAAESWRSHKQGYLNQVRQASASVHRVVLADKLHNGRSLLGNFQQFGDTTWQHFRGTPTDILWLYQQWNVLFDDLKPGWMANELKHVVTLLHPWVNASEVLEASISNGR